MNEDVIHSIWLRVGTEIKFDNIKPNLCGRVPLGEKGIGRLGVHKLGNKIQVITKADHAKEVEILIDWNKLSKSKNVEDFKIYVETNKEPQHFKRHSGTRIIISELKSSWDRRSLREVYRNLNSLNSPFIEKNDSFIVKVTSNSNLFEGLPNFSDIRDSALYFGHCILKNNKITDISYEFKPWESLDKIDTGRNKITSEFNENELFLIDEDLNEISLDILKIGTIEFDVIIYELESQIFNYINTEKKSIKDYLRENGGIRVYRDGIRVYNYGERDNDWLGLDLKRIRRFGGNVSNNIIIGAVKINRLQSLGLREKSNREGFIENDSYHGFVNAINYALSIIVRERTIDKQILTTLYKKQRVIEPVLSDLNEVVDYVEKNITNLENKNEILKYLYRINEQYVEVKDVLIKSANAGLNLSVVIHEIDKLIHELTGCIRRQETNKAINISLMLEKIIKGYSAMIKKSDIKKTLLSKIADIALDNYEFRFTDHQIKIITNKEHSILEAFLAEAEAISVLTNLLDNAVFWLSYAKKENRMISVFLTDQITIENKYFNSIIVSDNGPGFNIPTDIAIKPFMTGKPHNIGSGLGLHVANEMMKGMKGHLLFIDKYDVNFPKYITDNNVTKAIIALCFPKEK